MTGIGTVTVDTSSQTWAEVAEGLMPADTLQGNNTNTEGSALNLTVPQVQAMLNSTTTGLTVATARGYNLN
jgi:hypothetical protein